MAQPRRSIIFFCVGLVAGALIALPLYAQIIVWTKPDIVPMLAVQPDPVNGFIPKEGSRLANTASGNVWSKDQVVPVVVVQPDPTWGFVPVEGSALNNTSTIIFVQPSPGVGFVPAEPPPGF